MDPEASVLLDCSPWKGLREAQVEVELSARYNRKNVAEVEQYIEEVWTERVTQDPWLFNGAKFRLFSARLTPHLTCNDIQGAGDAHREGFSVKQESRIGAGDGDSVALSPTAKGRKVDWRRGDTREQSGATKQTNEGQNNMERVSENGEMLERERGVCTPQEIQCTQKDTGSRVDSEKHALHPQNKGTSYSNCHNDKLATCPQAQRGTERAEHARLILQLGLTCYKDFLGTNWSRGVGALMRRGAAEFGDPHALLAQPLGVGGVLRTADGLLVLLRRSQRVAEAAGLLDIPGGHPEPKAVCQGVSEDSIQVEQLTESAVVRELFSSICMEIRDEVNIPLSTLSEPVLLGIALNHTSAGRPSAEFYISCSLSSEEVKKFYWQGGPEAHESTDIVFLSEEEMMQLDDCAPLWKELCPSAKGAVMLYRLVLPDILNVSTDK
ncbi:uridine diphosphate glucose pyrophosphatase NUDT22 [Anguilla anguilla]|uniref:uridine diphosphate glucose pyrophosphatase NUDT22 n=1 Tax=Anguilla anguilla TaxID=7936 RepID=UPI0015B36D59|nr:uridine diphosphate glucose pyrophosphatase NUDT22 [Anguilla anguilla]